MDPYEKLADSIVLQAVKDYRQAMKTLKKHPKNESARVMRTDCERFFRSGCFYELTEIDGKALLKRLKEEFRYDS